MLRQGCCLCARGRTCKQGIVCRVSKNGNAHVIDLSHLSLGGRKPDFDTAVYLFCQIKEAIDSGSTHIVVVSDGRDHLKYPEGCDRSMDLVGFVAEVINQKSR